MKTEDFTFPRVDPEHLTIIPSLWRISSLVHSNRTDFDLENGTRGQIFRNSFSKVQGEMNKGARKAAAAEEEEKMDMLWEDFNEEMIHQSISSAESSGSDSEPENKEEAIEECSRCHLESVSPKKKNLVLVVKVFKKLFLLQNEALIKKRDMGRV
ncbi:Hypothetical predicted protein [Olea europaea subsp. europaea]|uniref:Uncharacterized protein n=1 Tax=Olea europaea subsp. europaea TaxID=158383 RepID=A0A8S0Q3I4_OLEEU|nr:Hypothetical predicted protein [Olea europaea subsp. europaea]